MPVAPFEIVAGPADCWIAAAYTAFPAVDVVPSVSWTAIGRTEGGVTVRHTQNVVMLMSDQDVAAVKAIRSDEGLEIETQFMDLTLENYTWAVNQAQITTGGNTKSIELKQGFEVAQFAFLVRGPSAYGDFNLQYQVPAVVQTEQPEVSFVRDNKAVLHVKFSALATLDNTPQFGSLIHQTA